MDSFSPTMISTWLFLAQSTDHKLAQAKILAYQKIKRNFGSVELAKLYLEQKKDQQIEVVFI